MSRTRSFKRRITVRIMGGSSVSGLALGVERASIDGRAQNSGADFAFELTEGRLEMTADRVPTVQWRSSRHRAGRAFLALAAVSMRASRGHGSGRASGQRRSASRTAQLPFMSQRMISWRRGLGSRAGRSRRVNSIAGELLDLQDVAPTICRNMHLNASVWPTDAFPRGRSLQDRRPDALHP